MSQIEVIPTGIRHGIWQGMVTAAGPGAPALSITHQEKPLQDVSLVPAEVAGNWVLRVPIPASAISEGVQTFLITDSRTGATLNSFALIAGEALGDDIRAEVDLLRAELDMLKRAFRRHCVETT